MQFNIKAEELDFFHFLDDYFCFYHHLNLFIEPFYICLYLFWCRGSFGPPYSRAAPADRSRWCFLFVPLSFFTSVRGERKLHLIIPAASLLLLYVWIWQILDGGGVDVHFQGFCGLENPIKR